MAVAKRLEAALRPGDTVARIGGDEFTLLLDDIGDVHGASIVAERLQESLSAPFEVDGRELYVSASIGIALVTAGPRAGGRRARRRRRDVPREGPGRRAPRRLRRGHARARDGAARARDRPAPRARARRAARPLPAGDRDRDRPDRRLRGARAAGRTRSGQAIEPREFVPIADETGPDPAARALRAHGGLPPARDLAHAPARASSSRSSVNVSGRQLADPGFVQLVTDALADARLDPRGLRLEVAESSMMDDPDAARRVLEPAVRRALGRGADRRLRPRRVVAAPAAPLPRRRGQDRPHVRRADARGRGGARHRQGDRRARAQPRHGGDRARASRRRRTSTASSCWAASTPRASTSPARSTRARRPRCWSAGRRTRSAERATAGAAP